MLIRLEVCLLFAPANRHELNAKFPRVRADVFVLDLEDAVPEADRPATRAALVQALATARRSDHRHTVFVRINDLRSTDFKLDVEAMKSWRCRRDSAACGGIAGRYY
jgi:citrate lyase subunit beta / citryl-CoA lyase